MKKFKILMLIAMMSVLGVMLMGQKTFAVDDAMTMKKWIFTEYLRCANSNTTRAKTVNSENGDTLVGKSVFFEKGDVHLPSRNFRIQLTTKILIVNKWRLGVVKYRIKGRWAMAGMVVQNGLAEMLKL